jgi:hypothetical protein
MKAILMPIFVPSYPQLIPRKTTQLSLATLPQSQYDVWAFGKDTTCSAFWHFTHDHSESLY